MASGGDDSSYAGLALEDILPLSWEAADFSQSAALEHANEDTARALQAIAVYEETPRSPSDDTINLSSDNARLEAKLDLILSLVSRVVSERMGLPRSLPVILRSRSLEWQADPALDIAKGQTGFVSVWANTHIPLPLRLPCPKPHDPIFASAYGNGPPSTPHGAWGRPSEWPSSWVMIRAAC